jgi:hypothetical protein
MRERLLTVGELLGFGAIAMGIALIGDLLAGPELGLGAGLVVGGGAMVYLANTYSLGEEGPP